MRGGVRRAACGFTLIEVLVALGITAIALVAGLKATAALTDNALRQSDMMLAQLCAANELVRLRLAQQMPGVGESSVRCEQGGQGYDVTLLVAPTPNPNFRRVDAHVRLGANPMLRISTVMGRY